MLKNKSHYFNRVHVLGTRGEWSLKWDAYFLIETLKILGIEYSESRLAHKQVVYLPSRYGAPNSHYHLLGNKIIFDFFHGHPDGSEEAASLFRRICNARSKFAGIRVSNSLMEGLLVDNGFEGKLFKIPIGVELEWFPFRTTEAKHAVRDKLGIPQGAVVLGSFQKDGIGWRGGDDPKLIKGPDIFLKGIEILQNDVPELFVLLTGPARGYVKQGLTKLGVPFKHLTNLHASEIGEAYRALDAYLVTSREEGGPKAVLETMASGVPLITTSVGQVVDIVDHEKTAWISEVEDSEAIAHWALRALEDQTNTERVVKKARAVAEKYSHASLVEEWKKAFQPFLTID